MKKIPVAEPDLDGNEAKYVQDAIINEGRISSSGKYLDQFKNNFSAYCDRQYMLATSNGTTALHLALLGLGVGPGDEVIVPTFTFVSTAAVVRHVGATPVFIDSKIEDWTLDETKLDSLRTPRTKAIITVDIYGVLCNYEYIEKWCKQNSVFLIEDAAEAHGALYKGRIAGSFGDVSCFSFFGNKIITTGEGGACLTNDPLLYERMRIFKHHGMKQPGVYQNEVVGYNYRLTNVQAAIGVAQLERIDDFILKRKEHDALYRKLLSNVDGVSFQPISLDSIPSFWFFNILLNKPIAIVREKLTEKGIETRPFFSPIHAQKAYADIHTECTFPVAQSLFERGLTLPSSPKLTDEDIHYVVNCLKEILTQM